MTRREVLFSNTAPVIFAVSDPEEKNKKIHRGNEEVKKKNNNNNGKSSEALSD